MRRLLWTAIADAGAQLELDQGSPDPVSWRADATAERVGFAPNLIPDTIRYANRPSGIQQVISFNGGRCG